MAEPPAHGLTRGLHGTLAKETPLLYLGLLAAGIGFAAQPTGPLSGPTDSSRPVSEGREKPGPVPQQQVLTDRLGDPLPRGAIARIGTARLRHFHVMALVFSPDGKLLVSASDSSPVRVWDADTGKLVRSFTHCPAIAFSPDGKLLAGASVFDPTVYLWDIASGKEVRTFQDRTLSTSDTLAFSPDGKTLASGHAFGITCLWDSATGKLLRRIKRNANDEIETVAFLSRGKVLASYGSESLVLCDVATGKKIKEFQVGKARQLTVSPNGKLAALTGPLRLLDLETGRQLPPLKDTVWPRSVAFSRDGKHLLVTQQPGPEGSILLWDIASQKEVRRFKVLSYYHGIQLAFSPDGKKFAGGGSEHEPLYIWETATGKLLSPPRAHDPYPRAVAVSRDGQTIATLDNYRRVLLWKAGTGEPLRQHPLPTLLEPLTLQFTPDGKGLLVGQVENRPGGACLKLDVVKGKVLRELAGEFPTFSPDGKTLAVLLHQEEPVMRLYDEATGKTLREMRVPKGAEVRTLVFSADSKTLNAVAMGKETWLVWAWETATGKFLGDIAKLPRDGTKPEGEKRPAFTSEGRLAIRITNPEVALWDLHGAPSRRLLPGSFPVFSLDGRILAVVKDDTISLRESVTGLERRRFVVTDHGGINCLAFAADGRTLAVGYGIMTVLLWDVTGRLHEGKLSTAEPSPSRVKELWNALGDPDAVKAHNAIWELAAAPKAALPFLRTHLQLPEVDPKQVAKWIAELSNRRFAVRTAAEKELRKLSYCAETALRKALDEKPPLEVQRRLEGLLSRMEKDLPSRDWLRSWRALEVLEQIGTPEALELLDTISRKESEARLMRAVQATLQRLRLKHAKRS